MAIFFEQIGEYVLFCARSVKPVFKLWKRRILFLEALEFIGVSSLFVTLLAGFFFGAVLGYQLYGGFHLFGAEQLLGGALGGALFRDMAPVFASIMITGRAGSAIAAELASMRVSEQIDALEVMGVNPMEYLVMPKIFAGLIVVPILSFLFAIIACVSGAIVTCGIMGLSQAAYWKQLILFVHTLAITHCTLKAFIFGFLITETACYFGFKASGGAKSVGFAAQRTVVMSLILILLADYIITSFLPFSVDRWVVT